MCHWYQNLKMRMDLNVDLEIFPCDWGLQAKISSDEKRRKNCLQLFSIVRNFCPLIAYYFRALEVRRSAQKQLDQEEREKMDKIRSAEETLRSYGTFEQNNSGPEEMFEMFTTGPFQRWVKSINITETLALSIPDCLTMKKCQILHAKFYSPNFCLDELKLNRVLFSQS